MSQARKPQFSLKWLFALVLLVSLGSGIWSYHHIRLVVVGRYPLTIDYSKLFYGGGATGNYYILSPEIDTVYFPLATRKSGTQTLEAIVVMLNNRASYEEVIEIMSRRGWRPGTLQELLAFGETYPAYRCFPSLHLFGKGGGTGVSAWIDERSIHGTFLAFHE